MSESKTVFPSEAGPSQADRVQVIRERTLLTPRVLRVRQEGMFSEAWVWLAVIFAIVGIATKWEGFVALAACLLTILPVAWLWNRWSLKGLDYRRRFDRQRVFPGETIEMTLEVTNHKLLPLSWVRFQDEFPLAVAPDPSQARLSPSGSSEVSGYLRSAFSIRWYERVRRSYRLHCQQRGHYFLGPLKAESGDVFTLFTCEEERLVMDPIIVYPQIWPLRELGIPPRAPFGEVRTRHSLIHDPTRTRGIRDYRPEDGFRHVHWKASARRGELQTRLYEPTTDMNLMVVLNVATLPKIWMGVRPDLLERAVAVAASIANYAAEKKWTLGLLSNGVPRSDQPIKVLPGRSPDQLTHVLEALAAVTSFATGSIEGLLRAESPRIPLGATLVLVTAIVNDEILATLLQLREAGRRVVLVSLADESPPTNLPGIIVHHLPEDTPAFQRRDKGQPEVVGTLKAIPIPKAIIPQAGHQS
jgi:uncharacterized protein (DUF58 family)